MERPRLTFPAEKMEYLKIAYDLLKHPLKQFIADQLPDWIIIDMMPYWMVDIARENKVPSIHFSIFSAAMRIYGENASGITDGERIFRILNGCQAFAVRSCAEFEGDYLNLFERSIGKPVIPTGVLPREKPERKQLTDGRWGEIFKWLDDQKPKSVVFVGFGSECKVTKDQVYEIAHGLELSGLPLRGH
ncbi:UDP-GLYCOSYLTRANSFERASE 91A1-LIKE [Salix viminalis]|uniref:UDP-GLYCOSYLTRANSFERASE 91A1-LIKE n=1 Tax=Salix viminalis TaxID=40686 RepID=A0A9Q0SFC5_SALVM|nr:UDP-GLYCOSYLTRANSFERASE 91A1-LIKE [Salix viminalis]